MDRRSMDSQLRSGVKRDSSSIPNKKVRLSKPNHANVQPDTEISEPNDMNKSKAAEAIEIVEKDQSNSTTSEAIPSPIADNTTEPMPSNEPSYVFKIIIYKKNEEILNKITIKMID